MIYIIFASTKGVSSIIGRSSYKTDFQAIITYYKSLLTYAPDIKIPYSSALATPCTPAGICTAHRQPLHPAGLLPGKVSLYSKSAQKKPDPSAVPIAAMEDYIWFATSKASHIAYIILATCFASPSKYNSGISNCSSSYKLFTLL